MQLIDKKDELKNEYDASGMFNLQNLYHISGGDEQFVKQMLDSFIQTTEKGLEEIKASIMKLWSGVRFLNLLIS